MLHLGGCAVRMSLNSRRLRVFSQNNSTTNIMQIRQTVQSPERDHRQTDGHNAPRETFLVTSQERLVNSSWETGRLLAGQGSFMYFMKANSHCSAHNSLSLHAIHSQLNPDHRSTVTFYSKFIYGKMSHVVFNQQVIPLKHHVSH
jgi:hypothetical protein